MFTYDYSDSRYNSLSTITSSNVNSLHQVWKYSTGSVVTSQPIVESGVVYFADWSGNVYAVNIANGALIWKRNMGGAISSTLEVANGLVYGSLSPHGPIPEAFALNAANGAVVWDVTISNLP